MRYSGIENPIVFRDANPNACQQHNIRNCFECMYGDEYRASQSVSDMMRDYEQFQTQYQADRNRFWRRVSSVIVCLFIFMLQCTVVTMASYDTIDMIGATIMLILLALVQWLEIKSCNQ